MDRHVLISVDDSINSIRVVDYAALVSGVVHDLKYTLMNVHPPVPSFLVEEGRRDPRTHGEVARLKRKNEEAARKVLERCRERMVSRGIEEERIELVAQPRRRGIAHDILEKAEKGLYDALLVGRRGLSRAQQIFMGSVSSTIINNAREIPVWIVDGEIASLRILVAVDGSQSSLRAVDHLLHMVGRNPQVEITFFHVTPKLVDYCTIDFGEEEAESLESVLRSEDEKCIDSFYAKVQAMLKEAGLPPDRVTIRTKTTRMSVARTIRDEALRGDYGTVVIGRKGENKAFFMGSVSTKLIQIMTNRALWVTV